MVPPQLSRATSTRRRPEFSIEPSGFRYGICRSGVTVASMADPALEVRLLGPVDVRFDGSPLRVDTRKALALLAYLVVTDRPASRVSLATLLWPDSDDDGARGALRLRRS